MSHATYAALELGGTKAIAMVGKNAHQIEHRLRIPTTSPQETLSAVIQFFKQHGTVQSIGVGTFGPVDVEPRSATYGCIEATPKPGWSGANIVAPLREQLSCPVTIDSDVNAAALGEYVLGAGRGVDNFIYVTVGTGIGGGAFVRGKAVHGLSHPEMGHMQVPRVLDDNAFVSACPFHPNCVEGLASGTAIKKRWQQSLDELPEDHPAWNMQASYLAKLFSTMVFMYSPQKIIVGGGVASEKLLQKVRPKLLKELNGYVAKLNAMGDLSSFLCLPELGDDAGPLGSFLLAMPSHLYT